MFNKLKRYREDKYRRRKLVFWLSLCGVALLAVLLLFVWPLLRPEPKRELIRAGICGAVNRPAVYSLAKGADLAMLVRMAGGVTSTADFARVDLDRLVLNDTIYHIPARGVAGGGLSLMDALKEPLSAPFTDISKLVAAELGQKEIRKYTILYVGLPSVFVLITYAPDLKRIQFTHIPHSALFLNNDYRLQDIFFTVNIKPTVKLLENRLKQKIDYYLIQNRSAFIELIDRLHGIDITLDEPYAKAYSMKPGTGHLDGFHAWEYIRFLNIRNMSVTHTSGKDMDLIRHDNFKAAPRSWELEYELRNQRQRMVLNGMRIAFAGLDTDGQLMVINNFARLFETDMDSGFILQLYKDVLQVPAFSFGAFPGYYSGENSKLYFYPDMPGYEMLLKKEIRTSLQGIKTREQTVY